MKIAVNYGEFDDLPILDKSRELENYLGEEICVESLKSEPFLLTVTQDMKKRASTYDVISFAPVWIQQVVEKRGILDLGGLIENKATTYDTIEGLNGDFFENYLGYNAWYNEKTQMPGQARGSGLIAIPGAHSGGAVLNYRQDILDKYHLPVPQTWEEFNEAAKKITSSESGVYGATIYGNTKGFFPIFDWYNRLVSLGGKQFRGTVGGRSITSCANSTEGIKAYNLIKDLLPFMPKDALDTTLEIGKEKMLQGEIAMQINVTSFTMPGDFYDRNSSKVYDTIETEQIPGEKGFRGVGYGGGLSWSIPRNAKNINNSWKCIQFLASKTFDKYRCMKYGTTPMRRSTVQDTNVQKAQPWIRCMEPIIDRAVEPEYFYIPEAFDIAAIINDIIRTGLQNELEASLVMKELDKKINEVLIRGGWKLNG